MKKHQLQLVDNSYTVEEGKEVLFSLLNEMKFLKVRMLNNLDKFGHCPAALEKRLEDLKIEKEQLFDLQMQYEGRENIPLDVDCIVDIRIKTTSAVTE